MHALGASCVALAASDAAFFLDACNLLLANQLIKNLVLLTQFFPINYF